MPITGLLLGWLVFAVLCVLVPVYRQRQRVVAAARKRLGELAAMVEQARQTGIRTAQEAQARERELAAAYAALQSDQFQSRWSGNPLEDLRSRGIGDGTLALLRSAGICRVADVPRDASRLPGIGEHRAMLISHRLDYLRRKVNDDHVTGEPAPGLPGPADLHLAQACLNVLLADPGWTTAGCDVMQAANRLQAIISRHQGWLDRSSLVPRGQVVKVVDDARAELQSAGLQSCLERAHRLARTVAGRTCADEPETIRKLYGQHRAQVLDLLISRFERSKLCGSLAEGIARKVEAVEFKPVITAAALRPYQIFGCRFVLQQRRVLLGDEMGLGKSLQAIAVATHLRAKHGKLRAIVVAPASVLENWRREVTRFSDLTAYILGGPTLDQDLQRFVADGDMVITSYETAWMKVVERLPCSVTLLVIDEAHMIKSPSTRRTRACVELMRRAEHVLMMTGTPLENRLAELIQLIQHAQPKVAEAIRARAGSVDTKDLEDLLSPSELTELVSPAYLRRKQTDVLRELPPCIQTEEWIELSPSDMDAYRQAVMCRSYADMRRAITIGDGKSVSAKVKRLDELLAGYRGAGRRVVVFSFFLAVLRYLRDHLNAKHYISGEIPAARRQQVVDEFSGRSGFAVLLAQISSCGIGLNVQAASVVVITEPQFKPSTEAQAVARSRRMGQTQPVMVHRLLAADTIDSHLHERLQAKAKIAEAYSDESRLAAVSQQASSAGSEADFARVVIELESRRLGRRAA